jgi:uncharacterized membrane protein
LCSLCVLLVVLFLIYVQELAALLQNPRTQRRWNDIITLDPLGMFAGRPTQSATTANMSIPELQLGSEMVADGVIVNKEDRTIACVKVAVDLVRKHIDDTDTLVLALWGCVLLLQELIVC